MCEQYAEFDSELRKNEFLNRHYECLPFIGEKYKDSRLLLIGESHYVPNDKEEIRCVVRKDFYDVSFDDLREGDYKDWINTRRVFERRVNEKEEFKGFFSNPATEIARIMNHSDNPSRDQCLNAMHQYAFMNYFKRPSYEQGKTIKGLTDKDNEYAYDVSSYIIKVLKPSMIIFVSKKAYNAFCDFDRGGKLRLKYTVKAVSHPSSCWWNKQRKKDGKCAREDFREYISSIFKKQ